MENQNNNSHEDQQNNTSPEHKMNESSRNEKDLKTAEQQSSHAPQQSFQHAASSHFASSERSKKIKDPSDHVYTDNVRKAKEFVKFMYMAIATLLGFRFILSLLGANARSPFVSFIYDVTYPPLLPFEGMFGRDLYRPSGYTLEFEILFALMVYAAVFYGFHRLIEIMFD